MERIRFLKNGSKGFIDKVQIETDLSFQEMANICRVNRRSFSDWKSGKCLMPYKVLNRLMQVSGVNPPPFKILPAFWHIQEAAKKGALARNKLYGNPGTPKGRSVGGKTTCRKFYLNPLLAKQLGFGIAKDISIPKKSSKLSELIGILLGDGNITNYQVRVYHDSRSDVEHASYVANLFQELFSVKPVISIRKKENTCCVVISSKNLIKFLESSGLKRGDKIKQLVDIPNWIKRKNKFLIPCLRGLIDTDGCFYVDKHKINGKTYYGPCIAFTNHSPVLLKSVFDAFSKLNYRPTMSKGTNIFIRRKNNVFRYFFEIGSSNPKHKRKFEAYPELLKNKLGGFA